jgi:hypothetical protein
MVTINYAMSTASISLTECCKMMDINSKGALCMVFPGKKILYCTKLFGRTPVWISVKNGVYTAIRFTNLIGSSLMISEEIYNSYGTLVNNFSASVILDKQSTATVNKVYSDFETNCENGTKISNIPLIVSTLVRTTKK